MRRPALVTVAALALAGAGGVQAALTGAASATASIPQVIKFTSVAPTGALVRGAPYAVTAVGGGSGNPVVFSSATAKVCAVVGPVVDFQASGTCTVDANQAGSSSYLAAATASQSFTVASGPDAIVSPDHATATAGAPFLFFLETTGSPNPSIHYIGRVPQGLVIRKGQGFVTISGEVPNALYGRPTGGVYQSTIVATFLDGTKQNRIRQPFSLSLDEAPVITSTTVKGARITAPFESLFRTTGYPTPKVTESGRLPAGVSFTDLGNHRATLSGVPNLFMAGKYPFTLTASNGVGTPSVRHYVLVVRR